MHAATARASGKVARGDGTSDEKGSVVQLSSHGITVDLPAGWEGRITKRAEARSLAGIRPGHPVLAERTYPITHLGNFALPNDRGDFGSGAVDLMGPSHLFVSLFEFGPESVGQPLFERQGLPTRLRVAHFDPRALQRAIPRQSGYQSFFTAGERAFSLYVVLGDHDNARDLVVLANEVLAAMTIGAR